MAIMMLSGNPKGLEKKNTVLVGLPFYNHTIKSLTQAVYFRCFCKIGQDKSDGPCLWNFVNISLYTPFHLDNFCPVIFLIAIFVPMTIV